MKCVLIEPDHSTFSRQGDCKYDGVGGGGGGGGGGGERRKHQLCVNRFRTLCM